MIIQRVTELRFPLDQIIVIGSGLLDAYGLRQADDIDLIVTPELYKKLQSTGEYTEGEKHGETYLLKDKIEVWLTWGAGKDFTTLWKDGVTVEGVRFVNPHFLMERKRQRGHDKDIKDIEMLEQYLHGK